MLRNQIQGKLANKNLCIHVHIVIEWPPANIWIKNESCTAWNSRIVILLKVNRLEFRSMESLHNTASLRNSNFCAHSVRLLRKLNHVFLWILSNDTGLWKCRVKKISMTSNVLPLHFAPSQASSSQYSNVDSDLQYCEVDSLKPS